jgi:hypothetical protein
MRTRLDLLARIVLVAVLLASCGATPTPPPGTSGVEPATPSSPSARGPEPALPELPALPAAASLPAGTVDEQAQALSEAIDTGGEGGMAALITAMTASGFPVIDDSGHPLAGSPQGEGVAVAPWEAEVLYGFPRDGAVPLSDLAAMLAVGEGLDPTDAQATDLGSLLEADIRAAASSHDPRTRFWGRFLVARLATGPVSGDILAGDVDPNEVALDSIGAWFVIYAAAGDALFSGVRLLESEGGTLDVPPPEVFDESASIDTPLLLAASMSGPCRGVPVDSKAIKIANEVLTRALNGGTLVPGWVADAASAGRWDGKVPGVFDAIQGKDAAKVRKNGLKKGQSLIDLAVLIEQFMSISGTAQMDPTPLKRTQKMNAGPGESGVLAATLRFDVASAGAQGCLARFAWLAGIKLDLPKSGAIKGADVDFAPIRGFAESRLGGRAASGATKDAIVQFYGGDPHHRTTDDSGRATIGVQGLPQCCHDFGPNALQQKKSFSVRPEFALKNAEIGNDLLSAYNTFTKSNNVEFAFKFALEMAKRLRLASSGTFSFEVIDWTQGWTLDQANPIAPFTGRKCDDPAKPWTMIQVVDAGVISINGTWVVTITDAKTLTGTYDYAGLAPFAGGTITASAHGTATITIDDSGALMTLSDARAKFHGPGNVVIFDLDVGGKFQWSPASDCPSTGS